MKYVLAIPALLFLAACGGGGSGSTPPVYQIAGSYYGTVVSNAHNSGNMGFTTDALGNGNIALQFPGEVAIQESFAPPVSTVSGASIHINGSIDGCAFKLAGAMANANTLQGNYTLTCSAMSVSATFNLPRGTCSINSHVRRMKA